MQHPVPKRFYDANDPFGSMSGGRRYPHTGSDYAVAQGSTVESISRGTVYHTGFNAGNGNYVCVYLDGHDWDGVQGGAYIAYLHLSEILVQENTTVEEGQAIGLSGNTGTNSAGPHLHITLSNSDMAYLGMGDKVDPFAWIEARSGQPVPTPPTPSGVDYSEVQQLLAQRGYYKGAIDGQLGVQSWTAIQTLFADFGFMDANYIDGIPGARTYTGMQMYAQKNDNYRGKVDGIVGPLTWAGFVQSLREDAPKPEPVKPEPVKPEPVKPEPVKPVKPAPVKPAKPTRPVIKPSQPETEKPVPNKTQAEQIAAIPHADLGVIIPTPGGRKWAYFGYALLSMIVSNTAVGFAAAGASFPVGLTVALAIVANLAPAFSAIAIGNVKK